MKHKLFTLFFAIVASLESIFAWDYESVYIGGIYYNLDKTQLIAEVTYPKDDEYSGNVVIPEKVTFNDNIYSVTSIGDYAFSDCTGLTSVTIPNSVTSIGSYAFYNCTSLTSIEIPNSVTNIGYGAFASCSSLISVEIPNSVTSIRTYGLFYGCSGLTSIGLPNSVTSVEREAFYGCSSLTSIELPNNITRIEEMAFEGCSSLTSIEIPNSVTNISWSVFEGCSRLTSVIIGNSVISIGSSSFSSCSSLTSIVWNAMNCSDFTSCPFPTSITSFVFGDEVEKIPSYLCKGMDKLTSIAIPINITSIGEKTFEGCSSLTSVVWNAKNCNDFTSCPFSLGITSFVFGDEVEKIPSYLCSGMDKLISVAIPNSVTSIGNVAFAGCSSLISVAIPNSVTNIGNGAFAGCTGLTSIEIPNSVTSIGNSAFWGCTGLTSETIPNSVTSIGRNAFSYCSSLTSVTIPESVTTIGRGGTFEGCTALTTVQWNAKNCEIEANTNDSCYPPFYNLGNITDFSFGENVEHIPSFLCYGLSGLVEISLPQGVKSIGLSAFRLCSNISSIEIPNSVTEIKSSAFKDCTSLTTLKIGQNVSTIGDYAFSGCTALESITNKAKRPQNLSTSVDVFQGVDQAICTLYVPEESVELYQRAAVWKDFYIEAIQETQPQAVECKISYLDKDEYELDAEAVQLHFPEAPEIEDFTFVGWQPIATIIEGEIKLQAIYKSNSSDAPAVVTNPSNPTQKLIRNGNVYILTDDNTYTLTGQKVK